MKAHLLQSKEGLGNSTGVYQVALDNDVAPGSLLVVTLNAYNTDGQHSVSISDTNGNTWHLADSYQGYDSLSDIAYIWYAYNANGGSTTINLDGSGTANTYFSALVQEYEGIVKTGDPLGQVSKVLATTISPDSGTIAVEKDNLLLIGLFVHDDVTVTITPEASWTQVDEEENQASWMPYNTSYKVVSDGVYSASWTLSGSVLGVAFLVSFHAEVEQPVEVPLILPTHTHGWQGAAPPHVPFEVNRNSPQYNGCTFWMPLYGYAIGTGYQDTVDTLQTIDLIGSRVGTWAGLTWGRGSVEIIPDYKFGKVAHADYTEGSVTEPALTWGYMPEYHAVSQMSLCYWVRRLVSQASCLVGWQDFEGTYNYEGVNIETWNTDLQFEVSGDSDWDAGIYTLNDLLWHHVCLVFNGDLTGNSERLKAYVDGVQVTLDFGATTIPSVTPTPDTGNPTNRCGIYTTNYSNEPTDNLVADIRYYNHPLSPAEVWNIVTKPFDLCRPKVPYRIWSVPQLDIPKTIAIPNINLGAKPEYGAMYMDGPSTGEPNHLYTQIPSTSIVNNPYSASMWVNVPADYNDWAWVFCINSSAATYGDRDMIGIYSDGETWDTYVVPGNWEEYGGSIAFGKWVHIGIVREDYQTLKIFCDRQLVITNTGNNTGAANAQFVIFGGEFSSVDSENWYGYIANAKVWTQNIGIENVFAEGLNFSPIHSTGLLGWWPFLKKDPLRDCSGNGYHLTRAEAYPTSEPVDWTASKPPIPRNIIANQFFDIERKPLYHIDLSHLQWGTMVRPGGV